MRTRVCQMGHLRLDSPVMKEVLSDTRNDTTLVMLADAAYSALELYRNIVR